MGILQMTGEVTERFNLITLFGMALFRQKTIEFFTKFIINLYAVAIRTAPIRRLPFAIRTGELVYRWGLGLH